MTRPHRTVRMWIRAKAAWIESDGQLIASLQDQLVLAEHVREVAQRERDGIRVALLEARQELADLREQVDERRQNRAEEVEQFRLAHDEAEAHVDIGGNPDAVEVQSLWDAVEIAAAIFDLEYPRD